MAQGELLRVEVQEGLMRITTCASPGNRLPLALLDLLDAACARAEQDRSVRAVLVTGEGNNFSIGADLDEIGNAIAVERAREESARGSAVYSRLTALPVPVIAAIRGLCLGGGLELALACHIRICSDRARLALPEVNLGLLPGWGGTQRLPRLIGKSRALRMMLTGETVPAQQALRVGLVDEVVPDKELMSCAAEVAGKVASKSRVAVRAILEAVRQGLSEGLEAGLAHESEQFGRVCQSKEAREGVAAFLQKRAPRFQDE